MSLKIRIRAGVLDDSSVESHVFSDVTLLV